MCAETDAESLVHTQMDALGAVGSRSCTDHLIEQNIGVFVVGKQNLVVIAVAVEGRPVQNAFEVAKRLDARAKFNAEKIGVIVQRR